MVQITLAMAVAVLIEAGLSYLGLGVQPPTPTWGTMLKSAQSYPAQAPWYVLAPGISIFVLVLSLNTVGDALRDRLDPRLRRL
jgi:peptide/nickel transport system permease protein